MSIKSETELIITDTGFLVKWRATNEERKKTPKRQSGEGREFET